jgi:hypothetical protein
MEGRNGIVQGYKVTHQAVDEWFGEFLIHRDANNGRMLIAGPFSATDGEGAETKVTSSLKTTLQSLSRFTNYSVSVLAFTAGGDGVRSDPLLCRTEEDGTYPLFTKQREKARINYANCSAVCPGEY